jgi:gamma-glutamylcyclotransferase (GGCT)/AIG2-like uncharacterized protein YtfP
MIMSLYFAYGSNLDHWQMRRRCPGAAIVGPAILHGHRLAFAGYSRAWGGPVATLVHNDTAAVEGVLYRLERGELGVLDRYEGYPRWYQRRRRVVRDEAGRDHRAHVYVLPRDVALAPPSISYFTVIHRAYRRLGFDESMLYSAVMEGAV